MISKTKIFQRSEKKRNPEIVDALIVARKKNLLELAKKLSAPRSQYTTINLDELNNAKEDKLIIVGKVLGTGELHKKKTIIALSFSESAREKLKKAQCITQTIPQYLESYKTGEEIPIL